MHLKSTWQTHQKFSEWLATGIPENNKDNIEEYIDDEGKKVKIDEKEDEGQKKTTSLSLKYKAEALKQTISSEEYHQMMRGLNEEQREIVMQNRKWIKETIVKKKRGLDPEPFLVYLSGAGGCGKSFCTKMIYQDNVQLFHKCNIFQGGDTSFENNPQDVIALLTAFTGTAAFNINGTTLHAAFQLGNETISDMKKTTMMTYLAKMMHLTIDEVSMLCANTLSTLNNQCAMIKHKDPSFQNFGNVAILAVGDLYQLPPMKARCVFE